MSRILILTTLTSLLLLLLIGSSLPAAGATLGPGRQVNGILPANTTLDDDFVISENGQYVLYSVIEPGISSSLFSVRRIGQNATMISPSLGANHFISEYQITPDSKTALFNVIDEISGHVTLWSAPIEGGLPIRLNTEPSGDADTYIRYTVSPNSEYVVFERRTATMRGEDLYSVPINGGSPIRLTPSDLRSFFFGIEVSDDNETVVFLARPTSGAQTEIYSVPISGGTANRLHPALPLQSNGLSSLPTFKITPSNQFVIIKIDLNSNGNRSIYRTPIDGGNLTELTSGFTATSEDYQILENSSSVILLGQNTAGGPMELYRVPFDGGAAIKLTEELPNGTSVDSFMISPSNETVVYIAGQDIEGSHEIYKTTLSGAEASEKLNPEVVSGGDIKRFRITPDSSTVIYLGDIVEDNIDEIYSVPLNGGFTKTLTPQLPDEGIFYAENGFFKDDLYTVHISDDSKHITYPLFKDERDGLYYSTIDGSLTQNIDVGLNDLQELRKGFIGPSSLDIFYYSKDIHSIFAAAFLEPSNSDDLCFPITTENEKIAVVCL